MEKVLLLFLSLTFLKKPLCFSAVSKYTHWKFFNELWWSSSEFSFHLDLAAKEGGDICWSHCRSEPIRGQWRSNSGWFLQGKQTHFYISSIQILIISSKYKAFSVCVKELNHEYIQVFYAAAIDLPDIRFAVTQDDEVISKYTVTQDVVLLLKKV